MPDAINKPAHLSSLERKMPHLVSLLCDIWKEQHTIGGRQFIATQTWLSGVSAGVYGLGLLSKPDYQSVTHDLETLEQLCAQHYNAAVNTLRKERVLANMATKGRA